MDYYDAILKCCNRYRSMMDEASYWDGMNKYQKIYDFNNQLASECKEKKLSIMKLNRWLGYIQGQLIGMEETSVDDERDWTRSIFAPLDNMPS